MKTAIRATAILLALAGTGCQEQRSTGTSTETENAIVARSFPVDSILPSVSGNEDGAVVATVRLDSSNYDFSATRADGRDLDVVDQSENPLSFDLLAWEPSLSRGRLRVRIDPWNREHGAKLLVRTGLPAANRSSSAAVWRGIPADLRIAWSSILVDDFEAGNLLHNRLPDSSFWYLGGAVMNSGLVAADNGRSGSALHVGCNTNQCTSERGLLAATQISRSFRSFRALDSLELWAKGTGRLWVTFESLDSVQMGRMARGRIDSILPRRAWTARNLTSSWTRIVVRPEDFDPADNQFGNVGWLALRDSINYLVFHLDSGTGMWIDDIRFHGIVKDDLR
jgi:hypothetical protein